MYRMKLRARYNSEDLDFLKRPAFVVGGRAGAGYRGPVEQKEWNRTRLVGCN